MAIGLTGRTGATVLSRVVAECRIDQELVPIPRRLLVESRALGRVTKPEPATKILAQVKYTQSYIYFVVFLGKCISSRISLETVSYLLSSFQLMETGLTGRTGATVLSRVVAECKIGLELVPILRRLLVEIRALERVMKPDCATKILAQVKFLLYNFFARFEDS